MSDYVSKARSLKEMLNGLADDMDEHRKNVNIARITGSSVAVLSGIAGIAAGIAIPFTLGLTAPLAVSLTATGVATAGSITAAGATITFFFIKKAKLKEANEQWEEFQEAYRARTGDSGNTNAKETVEEEEPEIDNDRDGEDAGPTPRSRPENVKEITDLVKKVDMDTVTKVVKPLKKAFGKITSWMRTKGAEKAVKATSVLGTTSTAGASGAGTVTAGAGATGAGATGAGATGAGATGAGATGAGATGAGATGAGAAGAGATGAGATGAGAAGAGATGAGATGAGATGAGATGAGAAGAGATGAGATGAGTAGAGSAGAEAAGARAASAGLSTGARVLMSTPLIVLNVVMMGVNIYDIVDASIELHKDGGSEAGGLLRRMAADLDVIIKETPCWETATANEVMRYVSPSVRV